MKRWFELDLNILLLWLGNRLVLTLEDGFNLFIEGVFENKISVGK